MKMRYWAVASISLACSLSIAAPTPKAASFTPKQKKDIEKVVHDYILKNPDIIVQAIEVLRAQRAKQQQSQSMSAIKANAKQLFHDPNTPSTNTPNPKVFVAEFFDYQCGHCRIAAPIVEKVIKNNKHVKFFFKELPIFGGSSKYAAKAALAAQEQGKYVPFHNAIFTAQDALTDQKVLDFARQVGLNVSELSSEMEKPKYDRFIRNNFALAQKLGIMGTPAFVISNQAETRFQFFPGAVDEATLQKGIDAVENK